MPPNCTFADAFQVWQNSAAAVARINPTERMRFFISLQSSNITFSEWIWLLTLAIAPLLAHIFVGGPQVVVLNPKRPNWLEYACLYNPTTIIWRYYTIALRRANATKWASYEAAVANTAFWTGFAWDGSEAIAHEVRRQCTGVGRRPHVSLLSKSAAQTIVVALQGAQTLADVSRGFTEGDAGEEVAMPTLFSFIALIGLYRLVVAPWLVEDFSFADVDSPHSRAILNERSDTQDTFDYLKSKTPTNSYRYQYIFRTWSIRILFYVPLLAQFILTMLLFVPFKGKGLIYTATCTALIIFATYLVFATLCVILWEIARGQDTNVVLPSVNTVWYKAYTVSLGVGAILLFILAGLETRRTPCGIYTTFPSKLNLDALICKRISYI
ncbi:hypothetical protein BKA66DRAFT_571307 [Pyrenochaeta sp. MPI-SDFR-AT-0127]|nr:hypothetical protein BKA66DRAFT_571307 [Pyrenochaeta sp. MPI-SDFR-AT-0127]